MNWTGWVWLNNRWHAACRGPTMLVVSGTLNKLYPKLRNDRFALTGGGVPPWRPDTKRRGLVEDEDE